MSSGSAMQAVSGGMRVIRTTPGDTLVIRRVTNGFVVQYQPKPNEHPHNLQVDTYKPPQEYVCLEDNLFDCVKECVVASMLSA